MDHITLAERAIKELSKICGISQIILYGSVSRGTHTRDSDIDLAIILDDSMRWLYLDLGGFPMGLRERVNQIISELGTDIIFQIPFYWRDEFNEGINLNPDILNMIGVVKFKADYSN